MQQAKCKEKKRALETLEDAEIRHAFDRERKKQKISKEFPKTSEKHHASVRAAMQPAIGKSATMKYEVRLRS